jgi:hypothetical protein
MPNSEFFKNQITDPATQSKNKQAVTGDSATLNQDSRPFYMYKVVPELRLGDYDNDRNVWGKTVIFHIRKYAVYNNRDHRVPKSLPPKAVKKYDYFYTGQNSDVINFDIEFNALYYTAVNVDKGKVGATSGPQAQDDVNNNKDAVDTQSSTTIDPHMTKPVAQTQQTSAGGVLNKSDTVNASSVMQSFYTSAGGDMISIKLQILGDPEFIKQDDIYVTPGITGLKNIDQYVPGTGSLAMDSGEIYCYLTFNSPVDFDDSTGLVRKDNKYTVSNFSGYYRILTVQSEFSRGKFVQTLDLVRYPNQPTSLTNTHAGGGADLRAKTQFTDNPLVSKSQLDIAKEEPVEPKQSAPAAEETTASNQDVSAKQDPPVVEEPDLAAVAQGGETRTIEEATSADGNTVPVQTVDTKAVDSRAEKTKAATEITALKSENDALLAQSQDLANKNKLLQSQKDNLESDLAAKDPTYDTLSNSQIQAKYPEVAALQSQQAQNRAQIESNTATMTANANQALNIARASGTGASIEYSQGRSEGGVLGENIPTINIK